MDKKILKILQKINKRVYEIKNPKKLTASRKLTKDEQDNIISSMEEAKIIKDFDIPNIDIYRLEEIENIRNIIVDTLLEEDKPIIYSEKKEEIKSEFIKTYKFGGCSADIYRNHLGNLANKYFAEFDNIIYHSSTWQKLEQELRYPMIEFEKEKGNIIDDEEIKINSSLV